MPGVSVSAPDLGVSTYFSFKEPVQSYVQNAFNQSTGFGIHAKVTGLYDLNTLIEEESVNPYEKYYSKYKIPKSQYYSDLSSGNPLLALKVDLATAINPYIYVPLAYLSGYGEGVIKKYSNRMLYVNLGSMDVELNIEYLYPEVKNLVMALVGVECSVHDEASIDITEKGIEDHNNLEDIRNNKRTQIKTSKVMLEELTVKYDQLVQRINDLGIVLG